jgi:adenylate cyclase
MAAKIASIAKPNQLLVGEFIYNILASKEKDFLNDSKFIEVNLDPIKWKYLSHFDAEGMYRVYEYLQNVNARLAAS